MRIMRNSSRLETNPLHTGLKAGYHVPLALALALGLALLAQPAGAADVDPKPLHRKGLSALAARDWKTAVDALEAASAAAPNDVVIGTDYRQAVIGAATAATSLEPYVRCIAFFEKLTTDHPQAASAWLNLGFAHVDKIPAEGAITQVLLANKALGHFGKALELEQSWLGYYSRGHAYLFWPPIFGRVPMGIADLEKAVEIGRKTADRQPYYGRAWAALGDGYWRQENVEQAREIWKQGLAQFPNDPELKAREARSDRTELDAFLNAHYDTTQRVATNLNEIYGDRLAGAASK
jgi:tetratricopeptide (TPR) repeat protein